MSLGKECFPPANECHNCKRKAREGITDKSEERKDFQRCSGCHLLTYCDKQCQAEHWEKVHKQHCKFLDGRKQVKNSRHREDSCALCIDVKQTSVSQLVNIESPKTDCHIYAVTSVMKDALGKVFEFHGEGKTCKCSLEFACELPFPLGEVSGQYVNVGLDGMVAHALKIVNAVVIKDNKDASRKETLIKLWRSLIDFRSSLWWTILVFGVSKSLDKLFTDTLSDLVNELKEHYGPNNVWCRAMMETVNHMDKMNLELFSKFIDPSNFEDPMYGNIKQLHDYDLLQYNNQVFVSENNLWAKFKLWPTLSGNSLVILLPDDTHCQACNVPLTGEIVTFDEGPDGPRAVLVTKVGEKGELLVYCPSLQNSRCLRDYLNKDVKLQFLLEENKWKNYIEECKIFNTKARCCDLCLKKSLFSHRCSECYAAQYCSTQCQRKDLEFHKTVCSTWANDKSRKIIASKEQKKIYKKRVDEYFK